MQEVKFIILFIFVANNSLEAQPDSTKHGTIKIVKTDSSIYYFDLGLNVYNTRNYDSAITCFSKSLIFNPKSAKAYCGKCASYIYKEDYPAAVRDCMMSIGIDSLQTHAFYNLGLCYSYFQEYDNAISFHSIAIKNFSANDKINIGEAYYERGKSYEYKQEDEKARKDMEEAAKNGNYKAKSWLLNKIATEKQKK